MRENAQQQLMKKFIEISQRKWIKGINNSTNSVGLTFESLLNKKTDSMYFPDYYGIELKLSKLAVVYASKKVIDGNLYFRYYQITMYNLKSFEKRTHAIP